MSFSHEITISNIPADKIQKCKIAGQTEVVDSLLKRVVLLNRSTMELIAARNVKEDNTWELFAPDQGDGNHLLIGLDEGGNFNIDGFDRVSLGTTTFSADSAEFEKVLANAEAYYVEDIIHYRFPERVSKIEGEFDKNTTLEGIYFVEDVSETAKNFAEGHFEDEAGNSLDLSSEDYSFLKKEVSFKISDGVFKIREVKADNTTIVLEDGTDLTERALVDSYSSVLDKNLEFCGIGQDVIKFFPTNRVFSVFKDNAPVNLNINFKTNVENTFFTFSEVTQEGFSIGKENPSYRGKAFDKVTTDPNATGSWYAYDNGYTNTGWVGQDFGSENKKIITKYTILPYTSSTAPVTWTFEASNTGAWEGEESVLDVHTDMALVGDTLYSYSFENEKAYRYYRVNVTLNGGSSYLVIKEIEMWGETVSLDLLLKQANPKYFTISKDSVDSYAENIKIGVDLSKIPKVFDEITDYTELSIVFQDSEFLDIEVERFDLGNKKGLIWFSLPYVSHIEDTHFVLLYPYSKSNIFMTETSHEYDLYQDNLFVYHMTDLPEGLGAVRDSSSNINHATPSGMTAANQGIGLLSSPEYNFTGSEIINAGNIIPEKIREGTIEAVFKTTSNKAHLLSQDSATVGDRDVNLSIGTPTGVMNSIADGYLNFEVNGNQTGDTVNIASSIPVNDNQYHYLGISFYNGIFGMVIDENKNVPITDYRAFGNTDNFLVGYDGTKYLSGTVSEVLISDKFIDAEALNLMNKSMQDSLFEYGSGEGMFINGYKYRKKLTIDSSKIDSDLTHFPVPVPIGVSVGMSAQDVTDIFDEVGSDYFKIAVTMADEETQLYVEVEQWDDVNEKALLWVSRDTWNILSDSNTDIYLYFDASAPDNTDYVGTPGNRTEVWKSAFSCVWQFAESSGDAIDSTGNGYTGTVSSSGVTREIEGQANGAYEFDGSGSVKNENFADVASNDDTFALVCSAKVNTFGKDGAYSLGSDSSQYVYLYIGEGSASDNGIRVRYQNIGDVFIAGDLSDKEWHRIWFVQWGHNSRELFVDGVSVATDTRSGSIIATKLTAGKQALHSQYFDGGLDAIQVLSDVSGISADWIKADSAALFDNLLTWGETEQPPALSVAATFTSNKVLQNVPVKFNLTVSSGTAGILTDETKITVNSNFNNIVLEKVHWSTGTEAILWGLLPEVLKGENTLAIFQNDEANPNIGGIGSTQGQEVFQDFKAVYHLNQDPAAIKDSTGNNPDATAYNLTATDVSKDGTVLNGTDQYIDLGQITTEEFDQGQVHLSFKTTDTDKPVLTKGIDSFKLSSTGTLDINLNETINSEITINDNAFQTVSFSFDKHKTDLIVSGTDEFKFGCFGSNGLADLLIGGNYLGANFEGSIVDFRFNTKSRYQDDLALQGKMWKENLIQDLNEPQIIPAFSFDNGTTFKTYVNSAWKAVATNDEAVHLVTGDSDWYYIDDTGIWNKAFQNNSNFALKQAMQFQENMCHVETIRNLTSAEWTSTGGMTAEGNIQIAFCYNSKIDSLCPSITDVNVDNKIILSHQSYSLEPYSGKITGSKMEWVVQFFEGVSFDTELVEVYSIVTGGTWQKCTRNESIPDIVPSMDTTGKHLQVKVVVPVNIPESVIVTLTPKIF